MEDEGGGQPSYRNSEGLVEVFSLTRMAASVLLLPCIQVHVDRGRGADQLQKATALETIQKRFQRINRIVIAFSEPLHDQHCIVCKEV